jgi:hypothetical protein
LVLNYNEPLEFWPQRRDQARKWRSVWLSLDADNHHLTIVWFPTSRRRAGSLTLCLS